MCIYIIIHIYVWVYVLLLAGFTSLSLSYLPARLHSVPATLLLRFRLLSPLAVDDR
jgi:hypothetical protein